MRIGVDDGECVETTLVTNTRGMAEHLLGAVAVDHLLAPSVTGRQFHGRSPCWITAIGTGGKCPTLISIKVIAERTAAGASMEYDRNAWPADGILADRA
jgi:hypothetical protein